MIFNIKINYTIKQNKNQTKSQQFSYKYIMICDYVIKNAKRIHFIGIGGISVSGLAYMALKSKIKVSGSDLQSNDAVKKLIKCGAKINIPHSADAIKNQNLVVYSGAIKKDNCELVRAKALNIPCVERSEYLGFVSSRFKKSIAVAGTHGKTTTTAMLAKCFIDYGLNPAVHLGGECDFLNGSVRSGKDILISEACEYRKSFLKLKRDCAILLNIEVDHLDYYKSMEKLESAFIKFANKANCLVASYELHKKLNFKSGKVITVSISNENANFYAKNIYLSKNGLRFFEVYKDNKFYYNFALKLVGNFNVFNALCVIALCDEFNVDKFSIHKSLLEFSGVKRRFEKLGKLNNVQVIHDYAHHPTEISSVVMASREMYSGKVTCVFQPHTYSRTKDLFKEFVSALSSEDIDELIILPTYSAREVEMDGVSGLGLANEISRIKNNCKYMTMGKAQKYLLEKSNSSEGVYLILGAGNVENLARGLLKDNT